MPEDPTRELVFNALLYIALPMWVVFGHLDYWCHRATKIETTSGLSESVLHAVMGVQVGLAIFLGLFFEINVLVLLLILAVLIAHEVVAHYDVKMASKTREITIWETHVHSFLEVIPFMIMAMLVILRWDMFLNLITLKWAGHLSLTLNPQDAGYILAYQLVVMALGLLPYTEELIRCWRHRDAVAATQ